MKTIFKPLHRGATLGAALLLSTSLAQADQVILDDLIVDGSICVGNDCVNGESFGFDTLRLKENNLRIKAQDTSNSASFPSRDWQITFNDSSNGGQNKFSIDDIDGGRTPFTIEASAPSHSLYVDDGGRVGFGTSTPVVDLHAKSGNTPTLRLEQDGSSGFAAQIWDLAGNETNFFLRDATNGSTLPFRVFPSAPTNSLTIEGSTGDVGVGTNTPSATMHIRQTSGDAQLLVEEASTTTAGRTMLRVVNNGGSFITMENTATSENWVIAHENSAPNRFLITQGGTPELILDGSGNLEITGSLVTTGGGGACTSVDPCDAVFDPEVYTVRSIEEHAALMWQNKHLPAVGPTGPDQPINMTVKMLRMLNELEHAHIYIEQLHTRLEALEEKLDES